MDTVLKRAEKKYTVKKGQREELKLAWGRLIVQAVQAYGRLLETSELEERIGKLEEKYENGVFIPNEPKQKNQTFRR